MQRTKIVVAAIVVVAAIGSFAGLVYLGVIGEGQKTVQSLESAVTSAVDLVGGEEEIARVEKEVVQSLESAVTTAADLVGWEEGQAPVQNPESQSGNNQEETFVDPNDHVDYTSTPNTPPQADNVDLFLDQGEVIYIDLHEEGYIYDAEDHARDLDISMYRWPELGSAKVLEGTTVLKYTSYYAGADSFWYSATDSAGDVNYGVITVNVQAPYEELPQYSGVFIPRYLEPYDEWHRQIWEYYSGNGFLESIIADFEDSVTLPYNVYITMYECGEEMAYYDPFSKEIVICYEYISYLSSAADDYYTNDIVWDFVNDAVTLRISQLIGDVLVDTHADPSSELEYDISNRFYEMLYDRNDIRDHLGGAPLPESAQDLGDFTVQYVTPNDDWHEKIMWYYYDRQFIQEQADFLNGLLALPHDIPIIIEECNTANAFYYPSERKIGLCYEYLGDASNIAYEYYSDDDDAWHFVDHAVAWVLYHEVAHALIDIYDLPITGLEEDVADQFATLLPIEYMNNADYSYFMMLKYLKSGEDYSNDYQLYADTHSLDGQRAYNVMCWLYGSDSERFANFATAEGMENYRVDWCQSEYRQMVDSWRLMLKPYLKY